MRGVLSYAIAAWLAVAGALHGQQAVGPAFRALSVRVSGTGQGRIVMIDRGIRDRVEVGDLVRFDPRIGGTLTGRVTRVRDRSALVEIDGDKVPPIGTRGELRLPTDRTVEPIGPTEAPPEEPPEHPPWQNQDEEYTPDQPLLADVKAVRPEDRAARTTGRVYVYFDALGTRIEDRSDVFLRIGTDVVRSNPFGRGGELAFDAEVNHRDTNVDDQGDLSEQNLRVDRLSYRQGGNRFDDTRWEAGRFLQYGMPEFGALDGYEWSRGRVGGDAYGFSIGFMPEPDPDFDSSQDFQVAAWYHWEPGDFETLTVDAGVQKTLHNGDADRDLLVLRVDNRPKDGWDFHGRAWVDYYTSGDTKDSGFELTQVDAVTSRRYDASGIDLRFSLLRFPDIDRFEFLPPNADELVDSDYKRANVLLWRDLLDDVRIAFDGGLWDDDDDAGADVEVSVELRDALFGRDVTRLALFSTHGQFLKANGARFTYRYWGRKYYWDFLGEGAKQRQFGFSDALDDLPRFRVRSGFGFRTESGWDLSVYGEGETWEEDDAWAFGFQAQRSF